MLHFTAIFVFNKLTILQGSYAEKISGRPDMTFSCKQNRNSNRCLLAILLILIWRLKKRRHQNKGILILGVEAPAAHQHSGFRKVSSRASLSFFLSFRRKYTNRLMSRVDYGFNQWSVVRFVIKKLYVYLFMVKQCIYLVIHTYFMHSCKYIFSFYDLGINLQILSYF